MELAHRMPATRRFPGRPTALALGTLVLLTAACSAPGYSRLREADAELSAKANASLRAEAGAGGQQKIEARAYRGVVALLGEATAAEVQRAERTVRALPGVARVNNLILIIDAPPTAESPAAGGAPLVALRGQQSE
jgi:BON domain